MTTELVDWLLLDLNSYFASVEQQLNPKLRGKPVAIVPVMADTTSCIAASYEAKKFGVKTGTFVKDAKNMCPGIIFIEGNHENYIKIHHQIVEAVEKCIPVHAVLSIDEMAAKLMGSERKIENAIKIVQKIKATLARDVGEYLKCSVGLAPNRFLAKVASDMQKPDGLVILKKSELPHSLYSLKLRDMPGIGGQMEKRLNRYGIHSMEQLCNLSEQDMRLIWNGINGERFYSWLRGIDIALPEGETGSIGHSHVLSPELRTRDSAWVVAQKLLHKAAARLRKAALWTCSMSLSVRFLDTEEKYKTHLSMIECQDDITLKETLGKMWQGIPKGKHYDRPMKVSIVLSNLIPDACHNFSLFSSPRRENLAHAIDHINAKYGKNTVYFSSLQKFQAAAPTRIAFTNIPDIEV